MQKKLVFLSIVLCSYLVYLSENTSTHPPLDKPVSAEHNILLDLTSKTDKTIYDNLVFSNYNCSTLNLKKAICSQFQVLRQVISSDGNALNLYKFKTQEGDDVKIYSLSNGGAHVDFKLEANNTLHRYSFTSIKKIPLFANDKQLFKTSKFNKENMNSLRKTL